MSITEVKTNLLSPKVKITPKFWFICHFCGILLSECLRSIRFRKNVLKGKHFKVADNTMTTLLACKWRYLLLACLQCGIRVASLVSFLFQRAILEQWDCFKLDFFMLRFWNFDKKGRVCFILVVLKPSVCFSFLCFTFQREQTGLSVTTHKHGWHFIQDVLLGSQIIYSFGNRPFLNTVTH